MTIRRIAAGSGASTGSWSEEGRVTAGKALLLLCATLVVPLFLSTTVDQNRARLTVYTGTAFVGAGMQLEETEGACRSLRLEAPVQSVRNDAARVHVTLFADVNCTDAVSVVSYGEQDAGLAPGDYRMNLRGELQLTLLGQEGALSYRTVRR